MTLGLVVTWDELSSSAVEGLIFEKIDRGMFGDVMDTEVQMAGRDGAWVFPDARGNRSILARGRVVRPIPDRRPGVSEAAAWLNKSGYRNLVFSDEPDRYWRAYLKTAPSSDEWKTQGKFGLEWRAEPYAYGISVSEECVTATGNPMAPDGSDSGVINVPDDVPACPVIEITPLGGIITYYTLGIGSSEIAVSGAIQENSTQTVSSCSYTITGGLNAEAELNGAYLANPLWTVDASGEFPLLDTGDNNWEFAWVGSASHVRICIYWRERFY
jgi:predicted phage tail component-like protein